MPNTTHAAFFKEINYSIRKIQIMTAWIERGLGTPYNKFVKEELSDALYREFYSGKCLCHFSENTDKQAAVLNGFKVLIDLALDPQADKARLKKSFINVCQLAAENRSSIAAKEEPKSFQHLILALDSLPDEAKARINVCLDLKPEGHIVGACDKARDSELVANQSPRPKSSFGH